ncbi:MAG: Ldh family oxidoreductase [Desulfovibrio sp.]|nr:Ldh family oxidoreductase [Desulfovibrio sp.]
MTKFDHARLKQLIRTSFENRGVCKDSCFHIAEAIVQASLRGVDSHGIGLFPHYYTVSRTGRVNPNPHFTFTRSGASTAVLDADHGYGHHAGAEAMRMAVDMSKESGMGAVSVKHSTHFGAAAYYGFFAAEKDQIGLCFTNTNDTVLAYNGTKPFFGTNPVCVLAPMLNEGPFCLDMATSYISMHKLREHKQSGEALEPGWAYDAAGNPTTDPLTASFVGPVGGYKGYGLGMMVEMFCGMLAGGPVANEITLITKELDKKRDLSQFFVSIDIARFIDPVAFKTRLQQVADTIRALPRLTPEVPVLIPGDPEKITREERLKSGIPISDAKYAEFIAIDKAFATACFN